MFANPTADARKNPAGAHICCIHCIAYHYLTSTTSYVPMI